MFTIILVDYENVSMSGLGGYEKLSPDDKIYIFYSLKKASIDLDFLSKCKNNIESCFKVPQGSESVDKHMLAYLGYLISIYNENAEYLLVSKDKGFDNIVSFLIDQTKVKIIRADSITYALNKSNQLAKNETTKNVKPKVVKSKTRKQRHSYEDIEGSIRATCKEPEIDSVVKIVLKRYENTTFKKLINGDLRKTFGEERGSTLYKIIRTCL